MKQNNFPLARQKDIVVQELNEDILVYELKTDKVFCLNATSAAIWQFCNGKNDLAEIVAQFQKQTNQLIPIELVEIALENLNKENLLENYQSKTDKTSRREMIRKVGLATTVALPIITSIIAPSAIHAASCPAGETFCSSNSLFGFPRPAGCYDLLNGYTVPAFPPGVIGCQFCNAVCAGIGLSCVNGACVMNP